MVGVLQCQANYRSAIGNICVPGFIIFSICFHFLYPSNMVHYIFKKKCTNVFRSGLMSWHDTLGEENALIPLWKDPNLVLNYESFWSQKHLWRPYVAKAVSPEAIRNYELSLAACTPRIQVLQQEHSQEIIDNIQVCCQS